MASLPTGWEFDYDGSRWFYRYKATGITQFTFPKEGDEFPDCFDIFGPASHLTLELPQTAAYYTPTPEEQLESDRQRRMSGLPKRQSSDASATSSRLNSSYDIFGSYLGPAAYNDVPVSPLEENDKDKLPDDVLPSALVTPETRLASPNMAVEAPDTGSTTGNTSATAAEVIPPMVPPTSIYQLPDASALGRYCPPSVETPVGFISELPTGQTMMCAEESNPPAVELDSQPIVQHAELASLPNPPKTSLQVALAQAEERPPAQTIPASLPSPQPALQPILSATTPPSVPTNSKNVNRIPSVLRPASAAVSQQAFESVPRLREKAAHVPSDVPLALRPAPGAQTTPSPPVPAVVAPPVRVPSVLTVPNGAARSFKSPALISPKIDVQSQTSAGTTLKPYFETTDHQQGNSDLTPAPLRLVRHSTTVVNMSTSATETTNSKAETRPEPDTLPIEHSMADQDTSGKPSAILCPDALPVPLRPKSTRTNTNEAVPPAVSANFASAPTTGASGFVVAHTPGTSTTEQRMTPPGTRAAASSTGLASISEAYSELMLVAELQPPPLSPAPPQTPAQEHQPQQKQQQYIQRKPTLQRKSVGCGASSPRTAAQSPAPTSTPSPAPTLGGGASHHASVSSLSSTSGWQPLSPQPQENSPQLPRASTPAHSIHSVHSAQSAPSPQVQPLQASHIGPQANTAHHRTSISSLVSTSSGGITDAPSPPPSATGRMSMYGAPLGQTPGQEHGQQPHRMSLPGLLPSQGQPVFPGPPIKAGGVPPPLPSRTQVAPLLPPPPPRPSQQSQLHLHHAQSMPLSSYHGAPGQQSGQQSGQQPYQPQQLPAYNPQQPYQPLPYVPSAQQPLSPQQTGMPAFHPPPSAYTAASPGINVGVPPKRPTSTVSSMASSSLATGGKLLSKFLKSPTVKHTAVAIGGTIVGDAIRLTGPAGAQLATNAYETNQIYKQSSAQKHAQARLQAQQQAQQQAKQQAQQQAQQRAQQQAIDLAVQKAQYDAEERIKLMQQQAQQQIHAAHQAAAGVPGATPISQVSPVSPLAAQPTGVSASSLSPLGAPSPGNPSALPSSFPAPPGQAPGQAPGTPSTPGIPTPASTSATPATPNSTASSLSPPMSVAPEGSPTIQAPETVPAAAAPTVPGTVPMSPPGSIIGVPIGPIRPAVAPGQAPGQAPGPAPVVFTHPSGFFANEGGAPGPGITQPAAGVAEGYNPSSTHGTAAGEPASGETIANQFINAFVQKHNTLQQQQDQQGVQFFQKLQQQQAQQEQQGVQLLQKLQQQQAQQEQQASQLLLQAQQQQEQQGVQLLHQLQQQQAQQEQQASQFLQKLQQQQNQASQPTFSDYLQQAQQAQASQPSFSDLLQQAHQAQASQPSFSDLLQQAQASQPTVSDYLQQYQQAQSSQPSFSDMLQQAQQTQQNQSSGGGTGGNPVSDFANQLMQSQQLSGFAVPGDSSFGGGGSDLNVDINIDTSISTDTGIFGGSIGIDYSGDSWGGDY